jgi:hypothetical protein
MTHDTCQDLLLDLAYGELSPRQAAEVEAHLAGCAECRAARERLDDTRAAMRRLEPERPPEGERVLLAAARESVRKTREERPALGLPLWLWKASLTTVVVAAVGAVTFRVVSRGPGTREELPVAAAPAPAGEPAVPAPAKVPVPAPAVGFAAAPEAASAPAAETGLAQAPARSQGIAEKRGTMRKPEAPALLAREQPAPAEAEESTRPAALSARGAPSSAFGATPPTAGAPASWPGAGPAAAAAAAGATAERGTADQAEVPEAKAKAGEAEAPAPRPSSEGVAARARAEAALSKPAPVLTAQTWKKHPAVIAIRLLVQQVERQIRQGQLTERARPFQACGPAEDAERRLYADAEGRVVKFVRQAGGEEAALTWEQYYDAGGRLRHVFVHGGAVNGSVVEHRIWLDEEGRRLWEEQRFRRGRYPFPEVWPEEDLWMRAPDAAALRCGADVAR